MCAATAPHHKAAASVHVHLSAKPWRLLGFCLGVPFCNTTLTHLRAQIIPAFKRPPRS